jgi:o-succinylbenzoate synthase
MVSARGSIQQRELLLVRLEDTDGFVGAGEAAPLHSYDGVSVDDVRAALEDCRPVLEHGERLLREELLGACAQAAVLPQAIAAIDLALWDLEGRREGEPVWRLLGAAEAWPTPANATVAHADRAGAAAAAAAAYAHGFRCVKVKVGLGDDAGRLAAVRAATGPDMAIRLDANGAWAPEEAVHALQMLEPSGIELCEEPSAGLDAIAEVSEASSVPIALDESGALPGALDEPVCAAVCLKVTRAGGVSGLLEAGRRARRAGYSVYLASTLDGPLGISAALHAAAALRPDHPSGLATLRMFEGSSELVGARDGIMTVPAGAGLGDDLLGWYLSRSR